MTVELLCESKCYLGEGPCYDPKLNQLYWVDIMEKNIYVFDFQTKKYKVVNVNQYVGAIIPREQGGFIIALQEGLYFYDFITNSMEKIVDPEPHLPNNRFNDAKCDPAGRLWAGTMDLEEVTGKGSLYLLHKNLTVNKKIENVTISNGLAWSPDSRFMYYIDTPTRQVVQYEFDALVGNINAPKVVVNFPDGVGYPDGMTIDCEGMLWIAHWSGGGVSRWDPFQKKMLEFIEVPALNVTSCTFGGDDLSTLYMTTARKDMSEEDLKRFPLSGGLFQLKTNVKGLIVNKFKG